MVELADPADGSFQSNPKAGMRKTPIATQINVPFVITLAQTEFLNFLTQQVGVINALRAADYFSIAFRGQEVGIKNRGWVVRIRLHVKGLDRRRIVGNELRLVTALRERGFFVST